MNQKFLEFLETLMKANPEVTESILTEEIKAYIEILKLEKVVKTELTENGKKILKHFQDNDVSMATSKQIAEQMEISSRTVSGAMRKLVTEGFMEKFGDKPIAYAITEKGKNYNLD